MRVLEHIALGMPLCVLCDGSIRIVANFESAYEKIRVFFRQSRSRTKTTNRRSRRVLHLVLEKLRKFAVQLTHSHLGVGPLTSKIP